jgi:hypothetical protein
LQAAQRVSGFAASFIQKTAGEFRLHPDYRAPVAGLLSACPASRLHFQQLLESFVSASTRLESTVFNSARPVGKKRFLRRL